jgi:hypothetical protein
MREEVARAALRAAAKLAFSATLIGCGGVPGEVENPDPSESNADEVRRREPAKPKHDARTSASNASHCGSERACADKSCCSKKVHASFGKDSFPDPATVPADVKSCCRILSAHYDDLLQSPDAGGDAFSWEGPDSDIRAACCSAIGWNTPTCTPWGPPVPPAMRRRVARGVA